MTRVERLGDHVDVVTGFPFKSHDYVESGIRLLRGDNVGQGRIRWSGAKYWPEDRAKESARFYLSAGDVVLAMDRPWIEAGLKYAAVSESDLPSLLVQRVARLRAKEELAQSFLRYLVGSRPFVDYVLGVQTGTGIPHISVGQIRDFRFQWVPLSDQQAIAEVLGALDDKIALNEQICVTGLDLGDSCHQRVIDRGGPAPYATLGQLMAEGALQFGDGYRTKKAEHGTPGLPILRVAEVGMGMITPTFGDYVREEFRSAMGKKTSRPGDVVLTTKGTVGRVAMISPTTPSLSTAPRSVSSGQWAMLRFQPPTCFTGCGAMSSGARLPE